MRQFRAHYAVDYEIFLAYFKLLYMVYGEKLSSAHLHRYFVQQLRTNLIFKQIKYKLIEKIKVTFAGKTDHSQSGDFTVCKT